MSDHYLWKEKFYKALVPATDDLSDEDKAVINEMIWHIVFNLTDTDEGGEPLFDREELKHFVFVLKCYLKPPLHERVDNLVAELEAATVRKYEDYLEARRGLHQVIH